MTDKLQSDQERLMHTVSRNAFGSHFVFVPDDWKKGTRRKEKEAADLVWACDDCLILMFLTKKVSGRQDRLRADYRKARDHNLRQARTALRRWRSGHPISGRNHFQEFNIKVSDPSHVVVLSIADAGSLFSEFHEHEGRDMGVSLAATMPDRALRSLCIAGAGIFDIVVGCLAMKDVTNHVKSVSGEGFFPLYVGPYIDSCIEKCGATWIRDATKELRLRTIGRFFGMRSIDRDSVSTMTMPYFFNDIGLRDIYYLSGCLKNALDGTKEQQDAMLNGLYVEMPLAHYDVPMLVGPIFRKPQGKDRILEIAESWNQRVQSKAVRWGAPLLIFDSDTELAMSLLKEVPARKSHLREILDRATTRDT